MTSIYTARRPDHAAIAEQACDAAAGRQTARELSEARVVNADLSRRNAHLEAENAHLEAENAKLRVRWRRMCAFVELVFAGALLYAALSAVKVW